MKRRGLLAGIAALAALAVCLILFWLAPVKTRAEGELVLWYAGTDCPAEGMDALAARCEKETGLHVEAVGFPDENALADAFAEGRPDLLWCSHVRAYDIDEGEGLVALPETAGGISGCGLPQVWLQSSICPMKDSDIVLLVGGYVRQGAADGEPAVFSGGQADVLFEGAVEGVEHVEARLLCYVGDRKRG